MKIVENMQRLSNQIIASKPDDLQLANHLQILAVKAIREGIRSTEWRAYMTSFASNNDQLERLCGNDAQFNQTIYGLDSLAYVAANSTCGPTTDCMTWRNMNIEMVAGLDRGVREDEEIIPSMVNEQSNILALLTKV
jgi:hypothetical protein